VADETGVTDVADPLAGSYFVEYLTNKVEEEAYKIWYKIEEQGGMIAAVQKGYVQEMLRESAQEKHKEVERGDRLIVGVNELVIPPEEDFQIPIQELKAGDSEGIARRMEEWKKTRNMPLIEEKMAELYSDAKKEDRYNLMPSIIEAVKAYATAGEIMGVIRKARGLSYDPLETRLLREAKKAGHRVLDGLSLLVGQCADQFELFTGNEAPRELVRRVVHAELVRRSEGSARR
jgi:methylmalonyl-CoA mutase N-terminal domain/subunit